MELDSQFPYKLRTPSQELTKITEHINVVGFSEVDKVLHYVWC